MSTRELNSAAQPEPTRFVILASARTGSTHLVGLLNRRGVILCNGEVFHKNRVYIRRADKNSTEAQAEIKRERDSDPVGFLYRMYEAHQGCSAVGFKIFAGHNKTVLDTVLNDVSIRKVVLMRENALAMYSSAMIARDVGKYSFTGADKLPERKAVVFDAGDFIKFRHRHARYYRQVFETLKTNRQTFHLIEYTQLNEPLIVAGVASFVGIDPAALAFEARAQKQNSPDIVSRFANPEAVETFLKSRGLLHWRYEGQMSLADWTEGDTDATPLPPDEYVDADENDGETE